MYFFRDSHIPLILNPFLARLTETLKTKLLKNHYLRFCLTAVLACFGLTTVAQNLTFGGLDDLGSAGCLESGLEVFAPSISGTITQIRINSTDVGLTGSLKIYDAPGGSCGLALVLGTSNVITLVSGINTFTFSTPVSIASGTSYYIGCGSTLICARYRGGDDPTLSAYDNESCFANALEYAMEISVTGDGISWTGATNADWNNASNWSTNAIPTATDNVQIPDVSGASGNFPEVSTTGAVVNEITLLSDATLTVISSGDLTINGTLTNQGTVLVRADATGIGSLITNGTVTGAGAFQAEQYLLGTGVATPNGVFHYVSSPVAGATSAAYDAAGTNKLWSASEAAQAFTEITNNATALNAGKGYVARMGSSGSSTLSGTAFNTGAVNINSLTRTDVGGNYGYNLIGNPYPSSVSWDDATKTDVETTIWYRTHTAGNVMTFDTYNATGSIGTNNNFSGVDATGIVPPGQGFWVRVVVGPSGGAVSFDNTMRSHGSLASIYKQQAEEGTVRINLSNGTVSDETIVHFNTEAQDNLDAFDSQKMWATNVPKLYTTIGADSLTINGLFSIETNTVVDLGIKAPSAGNYTLTTHSITLKKRYGWRIGR